jgi:ABC-type nickel/cobalt efflux system permease component RcnA
MHIFRVGNVWQKTLWKILTNPALEVVAAIVIVLFAAWIVIETETEHRHHNPFPVATGVR